jgi:hypothetical protein
MTVNIEDLTPEQRAGIERLVNSLACLDLGHVDMEAFLDGDDVRFRCGRCKEVMLGGN